MASPGATGGGVAVMRSVESRRQGGLICDPEAALVAGARAYEWYDSLPHSTREQITSMVAVRTRWIDDQTRHALRNGIAQVVVVGSGSDTRYARGVYLRDTKVFELDFPPVLERMRSHLSESQFSYLRLDVPTDLAVEGLTAMSRISEFDPTGSTAWIVEGLTGYLSESRCELLFQEAAQLSGRGSLVLATFVGGSGLAFGPGSPRSTQHTYGTSTPAMLMNSTGWNAQQYSLGQVALDQYGRADLENYDYWLCRGELTH